MTTLVYRDGILASDTQVSEANSFVGHEKKIFKTDKYLFGICGDMAAIPPLLEFVNHDLDTTMLKDLVASNLGFCALIIPKKGTEYYRYTDHLGIFRDVYKKNQYTAEGSGCDYALGALQQGATAEEAVKAAMKIDLFSGGRVQKISFDNKVKKND
jgi:ATP-dependent protease HslVU (ClpYQ) peptidase subunit